MEARASLDSVKQIKVKEAASTLTCCLLAQHSSRISVNFWKTVQCHVPDDKSQSKSFWQLAVYRQSVCIGDKSLETRNSNFIFQLKTCDYSPYVRSSLMRGLVCRLQLLCPLFTAVIRRSESRRTQDHIFYSLRSETSPTWRAVSLYLYPPVTGWPFYTTRHWVPVSSPPTICWAMVEVFDPASAQVSHVIICYKNVFIHV
jgi:hypothetical protein